MIVLFVLACCLSAEQSQHERQASAVPAACATLPARLLINGDTLSPADETRLDTSRIQDALDHCEPGKSVRLTQSTENKSALLSGPLALRKGVTLVIEEGVRLLASREARDFQKRQGSCGLVDNRGEGCHPLISCKNAEGAGLVGPGMVDGRGGAPILGETYSWWDLAQEARLTAGKANAPGLLTMEGCDNFTLAEITLRNPAGRAIVFLDGNSLRIRSVMFHAPVSLPDAAVIQTARARNVTIEKSNLHEAAGKTSNTPR